MDFIRALIKAYCERPCQVLPNALWKTIADLEGMDTDFRLEEGLISHLEISGLERLLLYWDREREHLRIPLEKLEHKRLALVHDDYMPSVPKSWFPVHRPHFRLTQSGPPSGTLPKGLTVRNVRFPGELALVADFLNRCYGGEEKSAQQIRAWTRHPVYDPELWIWVDQSGQTAGLGIAEYDALIREGSLEWIQVLPEFRRRGVGRAVVCELLRRLERRAAFTIVSGQITEDSAAERLYRSCGFQGHDIWWLLRKPGITGLGSGG